ncbi:hypothetical protein KBY79_11280 [Synechococcus lacustris C3-12m-Tous]|uniref:hypothetical protein n=1 Tax=Synechococcus lacustris TaxID=2116544 RepID=UPI0020CE3382|nr:hypothetical protein [Synechococcus lacustris]MCP9925788.1 hypothetical protein [Synechococcus lacustris C3-12m-Tous]
MKSSIKSVAVLAFSLLLDSAVFSQVLPSLPGLTQAPKGTTYNNSSQNGGSANLGFGSSTSFGVGVSLSGTEGTSTKTSAALAPSAGSISTSIGGGSSGNGITSAVISNIKAVGSGTTTAAGQTINSTGTDASMSSGNAELKGVTGSLNIVLDPAKTSFSASSEAINPSNTNTRISSGNANANITSNTTVDIKTSNFQSNFSQAY